MCLAIYKPSNNVVPVNHLENGFTLNPHGAGFAFATGDSVEIRKGFFTFDAFLAAYDQTVKEFNNPAMLIHFRLATHGDKNEFNCHPWSVCDGEFAAVHNGIISIQSTKEKSDTGHFIDGVLTPALECFASPDDPALRFLVEQAIGDYNKICLMDASGNTTIYNEQQGVWDDDVWYSNDGYTGYRKGFSSSSRLVKGSFHSDWDDDDWAYDHKTKKWLLKKSDCCSTGIQGEHRMDAYGDPKHCEYCGCYSEEVELLAEYEAELCPDCAEFFLSEPEDKAS